MVSQRLLESRIWGKDVLIKLEIDPCHGTKPSVIIAQSSLFDLHVDSQHVTCVVLDILPQERTLQTRSLFLKKKITFANVTADLIFILYFIFTWRRDVSVRHDFPYRVLRVVCLSLIKSGT